MRMTATDEKNCPCCGRSIATIAAALDDAVRAILPAHLKWWRAVSMLDLSVNGRASIDRDIVQVAFAEAALIRQEFAAVLWALEIPLVTAERRVPRFDPPQEHPAC